MQLTEDLAELIHLFAVLYVEFVWFYNRRFWYVLAA